MSSKVSSVDESSASSDNRQQIAKKCKYMRCSEIVLDLKVHNRLSHPVKDESDAVFNNYLSSPVDQSMIQNVTQRGTRLNYILHIGAIPSNLNFSFGSYIGKGLPGRELGTLIESYFYRKYLTGIELPFKHKMISQALNEGKEVHVFRYWQHSSDQGAKVVESATLNLPFTNMLNTQKRSIDLELFDQDAISNIQSQVVKCIKRVVGEQHQKFDLKSLEKLIEQYPNFALGQSYKGDGEPLTINTVCNQSTNH